MLGKTVIAFTPLKTYSGTLDEINGDIYAINVHGRIYRIHKKYIGGVTKDNTKINLDELDNVPEIY